MPLKYRLTDGDRKIFAASQTNGSIFTSFYMNGWTFLPWQLQFHHALQPTQTIVGGFGSGKTAAVAMSAAVWAAVIPNFRFADVAPVAFQSYQMFQYLRERLTEGVPFYDRFVVKIVEKPFPKIVLNNGSELIFLSADKNAQKARTLEADWICIDQAENIDDLYETIRNIGSRMRGNRPDGSTRLNRLTLLANAGDSMQLWEVYDRYKIDPKQYFSYTASTYDNTYNSEEQMRLLESRAGTNAREVDQWLRGHRPIGSGEFFPSTAISSCIDSSLDRVMESGLSQKRPGFNFVEYRGAGVVRWELPSDPARVYMQVGDLGTNNPPDRNSGVIMVFDVTDFPKKPATLRAFCWVISDGMITPWIETFKYYMDLYNTHGRAGFDSTGMQKHFDELSFQIDNMLATGINFNGLKSFMLRALQMMVNKSMIAFPGKIAGIPYQLSRYKLPDTKLPQDIVVCLMMGAYLLESFFMVDTSTGEEDGAKIAPVNTRQRGSRQFDSRASTARGSTGRTFNRVEKPKEDPTKIRPPII